MQKTFYENIISYFIKEECISTEDKDLYIYALKIMLRGITNFIIVITIGLLLGMLTESIVFFASFFLLRKFVGGLHAGSYIVCFCSSILLFILGIFAVKYAKCTSQLFFTLLFVSTVLIICFSPVKNPNKPMNSKEFVVYKKISIITTTILTFISILCFFVHKTSISYSIVFSQILVTILMILGKIKTKNDC